MNHVDESSSEENGSGESNTERVGLGALVPVVVTPTDDVSVE